VTKWQLITIGSLLDLNSVFSLLHRCFSNVNCSFFPFVVHSIREFMDFTGKILVERTDDGQRTSVGEQGL
jgi:hypothetical protein